MKKLLSLPANLVRYFYDIENLSREEYYCTSDPVGKRVGSGGGTTWLLESCYNEESESSSACPFEEWIGNEKRILLHAGGQSRRLPAYGTSGKILTPIPVFRWERGQKLSQNLLSLQLSLYEDIMEKAPHGVNTLIASGDVYIRSNSRINDIPEADVVCYGMWVEPSLATNHGVFVMNRNTPTELEYMLQKPSITELGKLLNTHLFLMDIGIWLLSDRAVNLLRKKSYDENGNIRFYDLYSDFGPALGKCPTIKDEELAGLTVAIVPLEKGEFYHYGTSPELISSTVKVQSLVLDQREIMQRGLKPNPSIFTQNSVIDYKFDSSNRNVWIENSFIGKGWRFTENNIVTGIPQNSWQIELEPGKCLDIVPVGVSEYALRPYNIDDKFKGSLHDAGTCFLGESFAAWCDAHGISVDEVTLYRNVDDIYSAEIFPVSDNLEILGKILKWIFGKEKDDEAVSLWRSLRKTSADELLDTANIKRLFIQRDDLRNRNWPLIAANYRKSVFYQIDLKDAAENFAANNIPLPPAIGDDASEIIKIHDTMFRARVARLKGDESYVKQEQDAFRLLRDSLLKVSSEKKNLPVMSVYPDQIVWGRSPVRIDLAGGWTDTPPYPLYSGGNVINLAIELNGQPPLQVYVKPSKEKRIVLRSIDLGAMEVVETFEELYDFAKVGSPFSIPKAALCLAGFHPDFCKERFTSLHQQLDCFGSGIELTLLAAIPAGSGLGTSSILASTVLGAVSDFCGLMWDKFEICNNTLLLEQLLTTGGGWQDQYGGVMHGVKLLQTEGGFNQLPKISWLPEHLFVTPEYKDLHLLYYTGITRTAKSILAEIVSGMFLNSSEHLSILNSMKQHALETYRTIQQDDFEKYGKMVLRTWEQNKRLDHGTNPPEVEHIISMIKDYTYGYKLPGAGGGGYLYMVAKDIKAAARIREILSANRLNDRARFVDMNLSGLGLQISRS